MVPKLKDGDTMRCAFFDLDHTLTREDTSFAFLRWWAKKHPRAIWRFLAAPLVLALWKFRFLSTRRAKEFFFACLRGQTAASLDAAARDFVQARFDRLVKKEAPAYIAALAPQYRLVLASASPEFYVRYFAERLGFELSVATRYEIRGGAYTGRIEGENCRGEEKIRRIAEHIPLASLDRAGSLAFSDNIGADAPLLALAGSAFQVHRTEWRLRRL